MHVNAGTRTVALFEFSKGLLVLLTGAGLIGLVHGGAQKAAESMVRLFHLNPASRYPHILLDAAGSVSDGRLWLLAAAALAYAAVRFAEAYGLWHGRNWAAWFGLLSGFVYVPWEIHEVLRRVSPPRVLLLAINLVVVLVLARQIEWRRLRRRP